MSFEDVERKPIWCIHFWDMSLYEGEILGVDSDNPDSTYVRLKDAAITSIEIISSGNVFYSEADAERALFKAKLAGKKRAKNRKDD